MADAWFVPEAGLRALIGAAGAHRVIVNARLESTSSHIEDTRLWLPLDEVTDEQLAAGLRSPRPISPFKSVLMPTRELVACYGEGGPRALLDELAQETLALVGVRGSDCRALGYLDKVMLGDPVPDPFYQARRERCTVFSVDCVEPGASCFCNLLGEKAYAEANFDVNLSPIEGGYVVAAGSPKGEEMVRSSEGLLGAATEQQLRRRDEVRQKAAEQLEQQNADFASTTAQELAELMTASHEASADEGAFWFDELATCVQCGGCTAVCPTCYCFLLHDLEAEPRHYQRVRLADSCQLTGYSQMAGPPGTMKPDPHRTHMDKFQRRFAHKLWHDVKVNGMLGCVGCGRCRDTCPGAIDLRRVITSIKAAHASHG